MLRQGWRCIDPVLIISAVTINARGETAFPDPVTEAVLTELVIANRVLARHGAICVGASIPEVSFCAITIQENAAMSVAAEARGAHKFLTTGEIERTRKMQFGERPLSRAWAYRRTRAGFGAR